MTEKVGISLGINCTSTMWAVHNNVRKRKEDGYTTCPFDIMVSNYVGICECIKDDFKYLCDENYLELNTVSDTETIIYNNKYNFIFNHESPGHANLYITEGWEHGINHFVINNYENFKKRYSKRVNNFKNYLSDENNTITFIMTTWEKTDNDLKELKEILHIKYPNLKYNFILLNDPNGKDYFIAHLRAMRFTEDDEELKRLL
uniref:Papain-like cysteine peptidase n=1 Tax=viral metagenome TaxID=1070528 RepID=A0A6C0BBY1_9ZZZZ